MNIKFLLLKSAAFLITMGIGLQGVASSQYAYERSLSSDDIFSEFYVSASLGPAWASAGESQTFYLQSDIQSAYLSQNTTSGFVNGELSVGVQNDPYEWLTVQWGLAAGLASPVRLGGDILVDADPDFNNFTYRYKIKHASIAAKVKLLYNENWYGVQPYVSGNLGVAFNYSYEMQTNAKIYEEIPPPDFTDHSSTSLTYTLGIGIQREIEAGWFLGIGYEFSDWGSSQLDRAPGQTLNSGLKVDHVYSNAIMLNLTFVG